MNTARQTAKHMDTTDELRESIERFVHAGKVVGIEELHLLRLARQAHDEATLLGQRFGQLMREAEAFRVGMVEREKDAA